MKKILAMAWIAVLMLLVMMSLVTPSARGQANSGVTKQMVTNIVLALGGGGGGGGSNAVAAADKSITVVTNTGKYVLNLGPTNTAAFTQIGAMTWSNAFARGTMNMNFNMVSNSMIMGIDVASTNGTTLAGTSISGTNGNNWVLVTDTYSTNFAKIGLGDTIVMAGSEQYLVTGITNANNTLAIVYQLSSSHTNTAFTWYQAPMWFDDAVPRRTAMFTGGPGIGIAGFSIANDGGNPGGVWFLDGKYSGSIVGNRPIGSNPAYLSLSYGLGRGAGFANQFILEDGATFADLVIKANDDIGIRGGFTNPFTSTINFRNPAIAPQVDAGMYRGFGTNAASLTGFSSTNGNNWAAIDSGVIAQVSRYDTLNLGSETYRVVDITNANNTVSLIPSVSANHTNAAFTVTRPAFLTRTTAGAIYGAQAGNGTIFLNQALGAYDGKIAFTDGVNSTVLGNIFGASPPAFAISVSTEGGGHGNQFIVQKGALFNDLIIQANDVVSVRDGFTNGFGNALNMYSAVNVYGALKSTNSLNQNISQFTNYLTAAGMTITNGGFSFYGTAPSIAAGLGAGVTPTISIVAGSTDTRGTISLVTGTSPTQGADIATITFATPKQRAPYVFLGSGNSTAGQHSARYYPSSSSTTTFVLTDVGTALNGTYLINWWLVE